MLRGWDNPLLTRKERFLLHYWKMKRGFSCHRLLQLSSTGTSLTYMVPNNY